MALAVTIVMLCNMTAMAATTTCEHVFDKEAQTRVEQGRTVSSYHTHTDRNTGVTYKCTTYKVTYLVTDTCINCKGKISYTEYEYIHEAGWDGNE